MRLNVFHFKRVFVRNRKLLVEDLMDYNSNECLQSIVEVSAKNITVKLCDKLLVENYNTVSKLTYHLKNVISPGV